MMINIGRRLRQLEEKRGPQLPWHLPREQWKDEHLIAFLTNGRRKTISDEELEEIIRRAPDDVLNVLASLGGDGDERQPVPPA